MVLLEGDACNRISPVNHHMKVLFLTTELSYPWVGNSASLFENSLKISVPKHPDHWSIYKQIYIKVEV